MVNDLMSSLPASLTKNGSINSKPGTEKEKSQADISASERAERMVADIMASFRDRGGESKKDKVADIGGGSGGLGTGDGGDGGGGDDDEVQKAKGKTGEEVLGKGKKGAEGKEDEGTGEGKEEGGVHSARQGCEDCG